MFFRFLLVGGIGFGIDAGVTYLLIQLMFTPWCARIPAIAIAMTFTWLANRYFTYEVNKPRSTNEAMRYAVTALFMALINYLIYFFLVRYGIRPITSVTMATACQTLISFHAYKYLVFIEPSVDHKNKIVTVKHTNISKGIQEIFPAIVFVFGFFLYIFVLYQQFRAL